MKTPILGTGIIGTIYGWALAEAGIDVTNYVRTGKSTTYKDGVELDLLDEHKGHKKYNLSKYALKCIEEISPSDTYQKA
jgi:2-dehydropantoate 2-reductase